MHRVHWRAAARLTFAVVVSVPAIAQVQRSGGESQRFMQQYQQVAAEKTALQAQVTQLQADLEAAKSGLAAMKKERDALKARASVPAVDNAAVARLSAANQAAESNLALYKQRMAELVDRFRETAGNLKQVEADRTQLRNDLEKRNAAFDQCAESNLQLYEISNDVLNHYEHVGLFTKVSAIEPFTRIERTRIENLVDEYRARAQENRVQKRAH